jgi:hypothetical protein
MLQTRGEHETARVARLWKEETIRALPPMRDSRPADSLAVRSEIKLVRDLQQGNKGELLLCLRNYRFMHHQWSIKA